MNNVAHASHPTRSPCRIALVEDQQEIRESLIRLLSAFPEFKCALECSSGEEALKQIPQNRPDVVLMDIFLPQMSGIECTRRLKLLLPEIRILILTASDDEETIFPALEAGADGYMLKQSTPANLRAALLDALNGGAPMSSGIARRVVGYFREKSKQRVEVASLSQRERELLNLLAKGYTNKEIARELALSVETIHGYLKNVYKKMHVHSRAGAVANYTALKNA
ncbi:MAG TPA: response regulator transcription factor [Verrucomicrobiae bacterium]|jgi:DNA-binding NarL/FixJ family response regulator